MTQHTKIVEFLFESMENCDLWLPLPPSPLSLHFLLRDKLSKSHWPCTFPYQIRSRIFSTWRANQTTNAMVSILRTYLFHYLLTYLPTYRTYLLLAYLSIAKINCGATSHGRHTFLWYEDCVPQHSYVEIATLLQCPPSHPIGGDGWLDAR